MSPESDPQISGPDTEPAIRPLGRLEFHQPMGVRNLVTAHPWGIRVDGTDYIVPAGMETDGASIPRILWRVVDPPFYSLIVPGAIIHDAAYGGLLRAIDRDADLVDVDRAAADELLRILARWNGCSALKAWTVYRTVRLCGATAWRRSHARNADVDLGKLNYDWTRETDRHADPTPT